MILSNLSEKKIAIIASSINPIKQAYLLPWYKDLSNEDKNFQLFLGSVNKAIPYAKNYKVYLKKDKLYYLLKGKIPNKIQPLIDFNPKIIHLLTSNSFQSIEDVLSNDIKLVVSFRGFDLNVFPHISDENLQLTLRIFEKATILHFISEDLKKTAIRIGANPNKCIVIHRSLNVSSSETGQILKDELVISTIGRLVWEKGYIYALEAMSILKERNYQFKYYIAGNGADEYLLRFHIKRLNLESEVILKGELSKDGVKELLKRSDIYFQPSLSEALSNAIIEASFFKLPVVSSNIGGIPEVIENNISGFLSSICKPNDYADSLIKLIESKELRLQMGQKGHEIIKEKFDRVKELKKWMLIYKI